MPLLTNTFDSFGLDIGDRSIKAAYVHSHGSDYSLESFGSTSVAEGVFNNGVIEKPEELKRCIGTLLRGVSGKRIPTRYAHVCLPETQAFIKLITLDTPSQEELPALIREILPNHIPVEPDECYIGWQVIKLENKEETGAQDTLEVLVGVVPKAISDAYTKTLLFSGITPLSMQIEAEAILRSLLPSKSEYADPVAIIDIGATRSSFICYDKNTIQFTVSIPLASYDITRVISKQLELNMEEAEKAKRICGLDPNRCERALDGVLSPMMKTLTDALKKNIAFYNEHFSYSKPITSLVMCGGGSNLLGLAETLHRALPDIAVLPGNPLINLLCGRDHEHKKKNARLTLNFLNAESGADTYHVPPQFDPEQAVSYTTAIGLALSNVM